MTERAPDRHVALVVETSNAYARALLVGVKKYLLDHGGWSLYLGEHSRLSTDLSWLEGWKGDGVIARIENEATARHVRSLGLPSVDLSAARLAPEFPCVETNDVMIAEWAVEHFSERGLKNFAFCGDPRFAWSRKRAEQFCDHVIRLGRDPHEFKIAASGTAADKRNALARWLANLPKPVGVLACYDIAGQEVLEACRVAQLDVPGSVAVLGVDNDELMCNLTSPPLSSIQPDAVTTGYKAAQLLDSMMAGHPVEPRMHLMDPLRVVPRQSSDLLYVSDPLVAGALRYIRDRADLDVTVADVQRQVSMSRRALDYRFTQLLGRTVHDEIVRVRMARVADLLVQTDWSLQRIADRLRFGQAEYMGVAFRKHTGKSPGEYRKAQRAGSMGA